MEPAVFVRSCEPAAPGRPKDVVHEMPELLVLVLHNIKLLTGMKADWGEDDIQMAGLTLQLAMAPVARRTTLSGRETAIATLYFWIQKLGHLDGGVPSHPEFPLSRFLAERVNDVWRCAPELLGPDAYWQYRKVSRPAEIDGNPEQVVAEGRSVAETLALRDVVLDASVLEPGVAAVLNEQLASERCIDIARAEWSASILRHITTLGSAPAGRVYKSFATDASLARLAHECAAPAVAGGPIAWWAGAAANLPAAVTRPDAYAAVAARQLLAGLASSGLSVPQLGWASGMRAVATDDDAAPNHTAALRALVVRLWDLACNGYNVSGYLQTVRDIGTIIGYGSNESDTKALTVEFAGALMVWMVETASSKWPKRNGAPCLDVALNKSLACLIKPVDGRSFFDGLMEHFAESGVDPHEGIAHVSSRSRTHGNEPATLDSVLRTTMPPGMHETYAAMYRARLMADAIAEKTESAPIPESGNAQRRRSVRV